LGYKNNGSDEIKMDDHLYDVCVIGGLGHVGLPLGISLAKAGKKVVLYDINQAAIDIVMKGEMPFYESGAEDILREVLSNNCLLATNDRSVIKNSYFVIFVIGTPVDDHLKPNYAIFKNSLDDIMDMLHDNQHIILRSTILPETTDKVTHYLRTKGKTSKVSFCPERIAEGRAIEELSSLPQIISSIDPEAIQEAKCLFSLLTNDILVLTPMEAELGKLFTNVWRYILFSISNQFYEIAMREGVDFYKVYKAITYNYPRLQGLPRPGFTAGPCLFKDTMQLAAFSEDNFFLGHAAMLINEGMPRFLVQQLKSRYSLFEKTVGVLGMAFKANSDDKRDSLSYKLKEILEVEAKKVLCSDVYIKESDFVSTEALVEQSDIIILAAPHREYAHLKFGDREIVDIWDFYKKSSFVFKNDVLVKKPVSI
jgi:UDP-N-acetyl-D-mannosaminuronic acid dehydrogenase